MICPTFHSFIALELAVKRCNHFWKYYHDPYIGMLLMRWRHRRHLKLMYIYWNNSIMANSCLVSTLIGLSSLSIIVILLKPGKLNFKLIVYISLWILYFERSVSFSNLFLFFISSLHFWHWLLQMCINKWK